MPGPAFYLTHMVPKSIREESCVAKIEDLIVVGEESIRLEMGDEHLKETLVALKDEILKLKAILAEP